MKQQLGIIVVLLVIVGIFLGYQTISKQVATVTSQTQFAQVVVPSTSGLVGYYTLNEGSGGTANDTSGNNNTGSISGAIWTTGKIAGALSFNGTSNFISIPDSDSLDITGAGTIATWINLSINRWNGVFAKGNVNDDGKSYNYAMEVKNDNHVVCVFGNGTTNNTVTSTATIIANQLTHVACTWDGSNFKLYINGALNTSVSQTITPSANTSPLYLGKFGGNVDYLQGLLDEVRIYNRSLSTSEIQDLYNYTGAITPPPVTNYTITAFMTGTGNGNISSSPALTSCNSTTKSCSAIVPAGTIATLNAVMLDSNSTFGGWSGACTGTGTCTVTVNSNTSVTATFNASLVNPTVNITANPTSITSGGTSNISWTSTNATACSVTKAGSAWRTGTTGTNISSGVLTANTTFTATCTGAS